ncbi:MAG: hypothetical protein ABJA82_17900 [Myxococcales bacterium]
MKTNNPASRPMAVVCHVRRFGQAMFLWTDRVGILSPIHLCRRLLFPPLPTLCFLTLIWELKQNLPRALK